ncbi:hypothetical protein U9M48_015634 [Paspalum notatum var. saurae]|uniref:ARM repeat superfamily protein n=1 Tax=Paspalum notatum var. saurae TaxID=547442 RepID=A0AAQ3WM37_PASNO
MPVDVLLLLAPVPPQVVAVLLLNLRPPRIANLTRSSCGRKLLSWAKLILALCLGGAMLFLHSALNLGVGSIIQALVVLVLSLGSLQAPVDDTIFGRWDNIFLYICLLVHLEWIAGADIMIFTAILAVLLVGNYQIPAAVARAVLSSVRLYGLANNVDTYPPEPNSNWNLVPSVVAFYVLALCQGTLYLVACILELFSFFPRRSLVRHWFRGQWGARAVDAYYQHAYAMCMEIGVLAAARRMSLASFSVESLSSTSHEMQLAGVSVLDALLQQRKFSKELVLRITGSDKAVCTLVRTVGWTAQQDRDFRLFAARVTAELAGSLRLASIPGMLKLVSSLLEAQNQPTWHNYEQDLLSHAVGVNGDNVVDSQSPSQQSSAQSSHSNGGNTTQEESNNGECSWLCWFWQWCHCSIPKEPALTCRDSFPVLGMLILERLAYDIDNCEEIGRSADLILKITEFMSYATGTSVSGDDDPQQKALICSSLNLIRRLAITDGKIGMTLRQELWESPFFLSNLAGILVDNCNCPQLWKPAIDIIAIFALDEDAKNEIGSAKVMIGRLMHVFLGQDGATNMHYDQQLRATAGEALGNLSMESIANCLVVLGEPGYELVKDLGDMISDDEYNYVVTRLLHNLCAHSSNEMLHLGAGEHLSSVLPVVMEKIMTAEGKELEALINLASQMRNVIPERFVQELELHSNGADLVRKLVYTLNSNRRPCPKYPRMRRAIVQITISLIQSCPRYTAIFAAGGMKEALSKIDGTPSRVEKYMAFLGNTGLILESGLPLHILTARARGLIDSAALTPSG